MHSALCTSIGVSYGLMDAIRRPMLLFVLGIVLICSGRMATLATTPPQAAALTVVSAGPTGEVANPGQANEIRVVFSEPMVTLGRIPMPVTAPFFHISPTPRGTFRWSGTTILIFTPDPKPGLPYSTRYEVTIDTTAQAVSGRRLAHAYTFAFVTPTVKLLRPSWYRRNGTVDQPVVILFPFNQPVRDVDVLAHVTARFQRHPWSAPAMPADAQARLKALDPQALPRFSAKVAATHAVASSDGPVQLKLATDWDKKRFPAVPTLVVFEIVTPVPPESWVEIVLDEKLPSPVGAATPGRPQQYVVQAEHALFIDGFVCQQGCDPERTNPMLLRRRCWAGRSASAKARIGSPRGRGTATPRRRRSW